MKKVSNLKLASLLTVNTIFAHWLFKSIINDLIRASVGREEAFSFLLGWGGFLISLIGIVLGVLYSKWYFSKKNYAIEDRDGMIRLATIIFMIISFVLNFIGTVLLAMVVETGTTVLDIIISVVIVTAVFYFASKKIIKNTVSQPSSGTEQDVSIKEEGF